MRLFHQSLGEGPPIVILHGLFGSHDNWLPIARRLASTFRVLLPDLRNHGDSPHSEEMSYASMAQDIIDLITDLKLDQVHIVGHSMGGKVAMRTTLDFPSRIASLVVVDISPKGYSPRHLHLIKAMSALPVEQFKTRAEAENAMANSIPDALVRRFLLKSLSRNPDGLFYWRLNLPAIEQSYPMLNAFPPEGTTWSGPALFLKGEQSDYILPHDESLIRSVFPNAKMATIAGADHWVHADAPEAVARAILDFIRE